jgi:hypothetical protein
MKKIIENFKVLKIFNIKKYNYNKLVLIHFFFHLNSVYDLLIIALLVNISFLSFLLKLIDLSNYVEITFDLVLNLDSFFVLFYKIRRHHKLKNENNNAISR